MEYMFEDNVQGTNRSAVNSSLPYLDELPTEATVAIVLMVVLMSIGIPGNILAITSILKYKDLRQTKNAFILSLAAADMSVCVLVLPFNIAGIVWGKDHHLHEGAICSLLGSFCIIACSTSLFNVGAMMVNRLIRVCYSSVYETIYTWPKTVLICLCMWLASFFLYVLPLLTGFGYLEFDNHLSQCIFDTQTYVYQVYLWSTSFGLVVSVTVFTVVKITVQYKRNTNRHDVGTAILPVFNLITGLLGPETSDWEPRRLKEELEDIITDLKLVAILLASFVICWSPFVIVNLTPPYVRPYNRATWVYAAMLVHVESIINWLVYPATSRRFRAAYKDLIRSMIHCRRPANYARVPVDIHPHTNDLKT